ncbi:hypothetical protein Q3H92_00405, partial [Curtobacterium flaccumfaciens]|nr:hypothetical protein [Curtobacterium flaccumfaciens]
MDPPDQCRAHAVASRQLPTEQVSSEALCPVIDEGSGVADAVGVRVAVALDVADGVPADDEVPDEPEVPDDPEEPDDPVLLDVPPLDGDSSDARPVLE